MHESADSSRTETPAGTERDHDRRNQQQADLVRAALQRLRLARSTPPTVEEHRQMNRRRGRGGRRRSDRGQQWWQKGIAFAALCILLRCWRLFRR